MAAERTMHPDVVVLKFLDAVDSDVVAHGIRHLDHYLRLFPDHEALIRSEFEKLRDAGAHPEQPRPERIIGGRYRILESLGRGGFGEVFLAEDAQLDRRVAIKILLGLRALSDEWRARLVREATATSKVTDDGLCPVHDVGFHDRSPFLVMQWIPGRSLDRWLSDDAGRSTGPVALGFDEPPRARRDRLLELVERIARTLHIAHLAGVVHRDVKPANILIRPNGQPVLIDFGLAWLASDDVDLSGTGALGTPAYSAPEVLAGARPTADPRQDVWSLGAVLYECLTLQRPFAARAAVGRAPAEEPLARLDRSLGRDLQAVIEHALAFRADKRYQSAAALADDLARVRRGEPVTVRPAPAWRRAYLRSRARPLLSGTIIASVAIAIATTISITLLWTSSRERRVVARTVATLADSIDRFVRDTERQSRYGTAAAERLDVALGLLAAARELRSQVASGVEIDRGLARVLVVSGSLEISVGEAEKGTQHLLEALDLSRSLEHRGAATDADLGAMAHALVLLGDARAHVGDTDGATARYREAMRLHTELLNRRPDDPTRLSDVAFGKLRLGYMRWRSADREGALALQQDAAADLRRVERLDPDNPARLAHTADGLLQLVRSLSALRHDPSEWLPHLDDIDRKLEEQARRFPLSPSDWRLRMRAATFRLQVADDAPAKMQQMERVVDCALRVAQLEPLSPYARSDLSRALTKQARLFDELDNLAAAKAAAAKALVQAELTEGIDSELEVAIGCKTAALVVLATVARRQGMASEAAGYDEQLVEHAERSFLGPEMSSEQVYEIGCILLEAIDSKRGGPRRVLALLQAHRERGGTMIESLEQLADQAQGMLR